jgi:pimeloyl-ACP methyl ester carboxylesterase
MDAERGGAGEAAMTAVASGDRSTEVTDHETSVNGIRYHHQEAGSGPLVVLLHGVPDLGHSWRNQLPALAAAGYRAVAPDLRGCGGSEVLPHVGDYSLFRHAGDVAALIKALGARDAVLVGHDWGANLTWAMSLLFPTLVRAIVSISIPYYPQPRDPAEIHEFSRGRFDFVTYFQKVGAAEAEMSVDPKRFFRRLFFGFSGDAPAGTVDRLFLQKSADATLMDGFPDPAPSQLPDWLTEHDVEVYASAYTKTGLGGILGFYRNIGTDYPALKAAYERPPTQPVLFLGGAVEAAVRFGSLEPMKVSLPNLQRTIVLPGCGHWVQQERGPEVNAAIVSFLDALPRTP